jgi:hypothetical protein
VQSETGLQYTDIREGTGPQPKAGQTCVVDWAGVTIGYYGARSGGAWVGRNLVQTLEGALPECCNEYLGL